MDGAGLSGTLENCEGKYRKTASFGTFDFDFSDLRSSDSPTAVRTSLIERRDMKLFKHFILFADVDVQKSSDLSINRDLIAFTQ
jgi:hypothetical protein